MNETNEWPLVSIVLATYNGEALLPKQLESLFNQTYPHLEIIAVDDTSSDNTWSILQAHAAKYPCMKVFRNDSNLGFIKNFQRACSLASGELIACCDQDDYWHADKIKKMVSAIGTHPMIYCDSVLCDENLQDTGKNISDMVVCRSFNNCLQQAVFCRIYGHATLIQKTLLQKALPFLEVIPHDWWLSYLATLAGEIKYLPEALVYYRQHAANLFGAAGVKREKNQQKDKAAEKRRALADIRTRINVFYNLCPPEKSTEKKVLAALVKSYRNFSLVNNCQRVIIFLRYQPLLLAVKKRSYVRKLFFCFKMFVMIK